MKVIALISGGMDSVTALYDSLAIGDEVVRVLSFDYGSKHNPKELAFAAYHAHILGLQRTLINLRFINETFKSNLLRTGGAIPEGHYEDASMKQTVVPFRNGILLSVAAGIAESVGAEGVVIGAHAGDHAIYPDCREGFMSAMSLAIEQGTYAGIRILRPFIDMDKGDIVKRGLELKVPYEYTWTCYKGLDKPCGKCGSCTERAEAFAKAGVPDPALG